ncbi:MAG: hypothetical protein AAGE98_00370 [Actinomycetota bacterium]
MPVPPRTPVIIGRSQIVETAPDLDDPTDPIRLMTAAAREAVADAGVDPAEVDLIGVVAGLFRHPNPGRAIGDAVGVPVSAESVLTTWGGNTPIAFVGELGDRLARGEASMIVMAGGESGLTRAALRKADRPKPATMLDSPIEQPSSWGAELTMGANTDVVRGGELPRNTYAVFDSALRAKAGESLDQARDRAAELWEGYSSVAAANPDLDVEAMSADAIRNPGPGNRMVAWPYTKAMCANNTVDHGGALVLTTHERAETLGVPADQRVYLRDVVTTADSDTFLTRADVAEVPALDGAAAALRDRWGDLGELDHIDLYGCFPSMVAYTADAMGLDPSRELTVAGGLGFMGAPLNFAAGQALIAMVRRLRENPGSMGLVQGNGGHATKHAFGVFSTTPPDDLVLTRSTPSVGDQIPRADDDAAGSAVIDGITVEYEHDGPSRAVAICRFEDGSGRLWATSSDPDVLDAAVTKELVGTPVTVADGVFSR